MKSLEGLKGIVGLSIVLSNITSYNNIIGVYAYGCEKIGIWCLMILNGFLAFVPYACGKDNKTITKVDFLIKYYKDMFLRYYPVYIVVLLFAFGMDFIVGKRELLKCLIACNGQGHFWYIAVAIKFNLLVPFLIMLLDTIKQKYFLMLISGAAVVFAIFFPCTRYISGSITLAWYLPIYFAGIILAFVYNDLRKYCEKHAFVMIFISIFAMILMTPKVVELLFGVEPGSWLYNKYLLFTVLWSVLIMAVLSNDKIGKLLEGSELLSFIGNIQYEIYLIHYLILWKVTQYISNTELIAIVVCSTSIMLAMGLHRIYDRILKRMNI